MSEFQRVKDKATGHEYSVRHPDLAKVKVLDEPAIDRNGHPLPAKPKMSVTEQVAAKRKPRKPRKRAAAKKPQTSVATSATANTNGAEPTATPKEGSK